MQEELEYLSELDVSESSNALAENVSTLESLEVSITSLESLVSFFERNASPSLEQLAIADLVMANSTKDTDITPEDLVPSLESYVGSSVATEGLKDNLLKYYRQVIEFVKKIYNGMFEFLRKFFDDLEPLKEKFEKLMIYLGGKKSESPEEPTVMCGPSLHKLNYNYKLPKTTSDLVKPLGTLRGVSDNILSKHADNISKLTSAINHSLANNTSSLDKLTDVNQTVVKGVGVILHTFTRENDDEKYSFSTEPLFNNHAVLAHVDEVEYSGAEVTLAGEIEAASKLRTMSFKVGSIASSEVKTSYPANAKMDAMSTNDLLLLCSNALEIIKLMLAYRSDYQKFLDRQSKESTKAASQYIKLLDGRAKFESDGSEQIDSVPALKAILGYHSAIAKWSVEPFTGLMLFNTTTLKALYTVITLHAANLG